MTNVYIKTKNLVEGVRELEKSIMRKCVDGLVEMDGEEFEIFSKALKLCDDALDIAMEQARTMEQVDKKLDDLNCKMDILLREN